MPPPVKNERSIKDFFKPFTIPKNRIPANDVIEEEIVVGGLRGRKASRSPRGRNDGNREADSSQSSSALSSLTCSPTKKSTPRTTPNQRVGVSQRGGTDVSPPLHISPPTSQQRVMTAVEIPSPKPKSPEAKPEETAPRPLNTSFSSISTLSSVPVSTQSSSRRIIRNGIQAITNSDSGSAESTEDEELADISTFMPRKRRKLTPSPPAGQDIDHAFDISSTVKPSNRQSARLSEGSKQSSSASTPRREASPQPTKPVYKYSLMNLVRQREKEVEAEKRMRDMEERFAVVERQRDEEREKEREAMSGLKAAVADDSDEGERMMLAVRRTGALEGEEKVYYFDGVRKDVTNGPFPVDAVIKDERAWVRKMKDENWRIQACLSGFVAECASRDGMPVPVQLWMTHQLMYEKREGLCEAYVCILQVSRENPCDEVLMEQSGETAFRPAIALDNIYSLRQHTSTHEYTPHMPPRLDFILRLLQCSNNDPRGSSIDTTLLHLMIASVDANVAKDASLKCTVEDTLESLLQQISENILEDMFEEIDRMFVSLMASAHLRCRAVAAFPAFSKRSHALRRRLALHVVLGEPVEVPLRDPQHADAILSRLQKAPEFAISESTDYNLLNTLIKVLDIAIDDGFDVGSSSTILIPREREKAFNAQIDAFTSQLTLMSSRIRDAGTTHLQRTEAKSAIERLSKRLEYGVRTKPKPRKGIFSNGAVIEEGQRELLKGFLKVSDVKADHVEQVVAERP